MLAEHLARLKAREVRRMARDPAVDQAIRNYLAIATRALHVPGYLGQLLSPGGGGAVAHVLGDRAGLGRELGHTMLTEHDPASLSGLLDLLMEHGIDPAAPANSPATVTQPHSLARLLDVLHHNIAGHGTPFSPGPHPAVVRGYGELPYPHSADFTDTLRTHLLRNNSRFGSSHGQLIHALMSGTYRHLGADAHGVLHDLFQRMMAGEPQAVVGMHDEADRLAGNTLPTNEARRNDLAYRLVGDQAHHVQQAMQDTLGRLIHPALWHYGETGQLPQ